MTTDRILEFSLNDGGVYLEGHAREVDRIEGGGTWFCFETDSLPEAIEGLTHIGFTSDQIAVAYEEAS